MKRVLLALTLGLAVLVACQNIGDTPGSASLNDCLSAQVAAGTPSNSTNFKVTEVANVGGIVWSMKFASQGCLLFTTKNSSTVQVRALNLQTKAVQTYSSTSSVRTEGEAGVLGLEVDANFASNKRVYVCYSYFLGGQVADANRRNRVSAFVFSGDRLTGEQILLDEMLGWTNHNGCRLAFGPDGKLYVSMGEAGQGPSNVAGQAGGPAKAQSLQLLTGKVFRINPDGSIPDDNPFAASLSGSLRATWTYGHRNPQGLAFQPGTGALWSTEHGQDTRDELNIIRRGKNYGWPACAGVQTFGTNIPSEGGYNCNLRSDFPNLTADAYQPAVREYSGGDQATIAPSNATFYNGDVFTAFKGNLFFTTLKTNRLYRVQVNGEQFVSEQIIIDANRGFGRLRDVQTGPDGFIYISGDDGRIRRLEPN